MDIRPKPVVTLYANPWKPAVDDTKVFDILTGAAQYVDQELIMLRDTGQLEDGRESLGCVLLDPTRPRGGLSFAERVLATVELGPEGTRYLPNGAAKADIHDRFGAENGRVIEETPHCLAAGAFLWGNSAEYLGAPGGASGQTVQQDHDLMAMLLSGFYDNLDGLLDAWFKQQRANGNNWFTPNGVPGDAYAFFTTQLKPLIQS